MGGKDGGKRGERELKRRDEKKERGRMREGKNKREGGGGEFYKPVFNHGTLRMLSQHSTI